MPEIDKEEIPKNPELEFGFYSITYARSNCPKFSQVHVQNLQDAYYRASAWHQVVFDNVRGGIPFLPVR